MEKMRYLMAFMAITILSMTGKSQEFLKYIDKEGNINLEAYHQAFYKWSQEVDLSQTKGWKKYKRWEDFLSQRLNHDGSLPDPSIYYREAVEVAKEKQSYNMRTEASGWTPLGPQVFASPSNPLIEVGLHRVNTIEFHPTDPNTFWVGVAFGGVWKTTNGGTSYTPLTDDLPILRISDIAVAPSNTDIIYLCVGDYAYLGWNLETNGNKRATHYGLGIYKSLDGGATWNPTGLTFDQTDFDGSLTRRVFIDPTDPDNIVAASTSGIYTSTDGGANWTKVYDELIWDLEQDPNDYTILYASTGFSNLLGQGNAGLLKSTDFGATWSALNTGIPATDAAQRIEIGISPVNTDYVYLVACNLEGGMYGVYRSTDAGATWTQQSTTPNIIGLEDGTVGTSGGGTVDLAIVASQTDVNTLYVGGLNMWGSSDGGVTWNGISNWRNDYGSSLHADQHYYTYNPLDSKYYICNDGGLYATANIQMGSWETAQNSEGYTWPTVWEKLSEGINATSLYRIAVTDGANVFMAGSQDNNTYIFYDGVWRMGVGGDGMESLIHPENPDIMVGMRQYGFLSKSLDGGATFTSGLTDHISSTEFGAWTVPLLHHPEKANTIYAAWGNVYRSSDFGDNWTRVSNFPDISTNLPFPWPTSAMAISEYDPTTMVLSKRPFYSFSQKMQLYYSGNSGGTWKSIRADLPANGFITSIEMDNDHPRKFWVTLSGFDDGNKVFATTNGGSSWQNITDNLPNLPVNKLVHVDGSLNNDLYIGTDIGVYYRNDKMSQWTLYSQDLPNVIVNDLKIDYAENKLYAATFGRGVWITDLKEYALGEDEITGIQNELKSLEVAVYPNPSDGKFRLKLEGANVREAEMKVIDIMGRVVYQTLLEIPEANFDKNFSLDLEAGLYFVQVEKGKFTKSTKLLIEK